MILRIGHHQERLASKHAIWHCGRSGNCRQTVSPKIKPRTRGSPDPPLNVPCAMHESSVAGPKYPANSKIPRELYLTSNSASDEPGKRASSLARICASVVKPGELCDEMTRGAGGKNEMGGYRAVGQWGSGAPEGCLYIYIVGFGVEEETSSPLTPGTAPNNKTLQSLYC